MILMFLGLIILVGIGMWLWFAVIPDFLDKKAKKIKFQALSDAEKRKVFDDTEVGYKFSHEFYGIDISVFCDNIFSVEEKRVRVRKKIMDSQDAYVEAKKMQLSNPWFVRWRLEVFTPTEWDMLIKEAGKKHAKEFMQRDLSAILKADAPSDFCPNCHNRNCLRDDWGVKKSDNWILDSSVTTTRQEFDGAYTIGRSTTVFTKNKEETIRTYRCPKCGYKVTK